MAVMQRKPLWYFERRIEEAELVDDLHYAMTVTQQFTVPFLDNAKKKEDRTNRRLLIPLGWFPKYRLPDILVQDEAGSTLPFLRRKEQGEIGATLFIGRWKLAFFTDMSLGDGAKVHAIWELIQTSVERVITSERRAAQRVMYRLRRFLWEQHKLSSASPDVSCFLLTILTSEEFWLSLATLMEVRLLFTQMWGRPGCTYIVSVKYTERIPFRPLFSRDRRPAHQDSEVGADYCEDDETGFTFTTRRAIRRSLGWFGVGSIGIVRPAINLRQAASLWTIFIVPEGVEPVRCFWRSDKNKKPVKKNLSIEHSISVDATKAAAGKHHEHGQTIRPDVLALDTQIAPSSAVTSAAGLAALLFLVGAYAYKGVSQVVIGTFLAATPATIAGALAYRGHTFVRRISRGPRVMLALLSAQGALLAIVVSFHNRGAFTEVLAYILSLYSLSITGVFLFIRFGPRWRKNERSRWRWITQKTSPRRCRQWQAYLAVGYLFLWLLGVIVVARSEFVLQHGHIFSSQFPKNVSHAWWSWF